MVEHRFSYLSDDEIDKMISELRVKYRDDKLEALLKNIIRLYQLYSVKFGNHHHWFLCLGKRNEL
jgi:hypothetical protein